MTQVPNRKADTATPAPANKGSPNGHPWQFSLRQMFAATTGIAILFGLAAWGGWIESDAVVYLSIAVLAGVFSRAARWALLGALSILGAVWLAVSLAGIMFGYHGRNVDPRAIWIFSPLAIASPVFLRACARATAWSLIGSLVLIELFIAALIIYTWGSSTLFQTLATYYRDGSFHHYLLSNFSEQRWYIAAPWLLGVGIGEIIVRRRKPSGGERQLV